MERITIDADLPEKLKNLTSTAQLVNDEGFVVAVVQPHLDAGQYEMIGEDIGVDELELRCQPGRKSYSTDEVLAKLRKLA